MTQEKENIAQEKENMTMIGFDLNRYAESIRDLGYSDTSKESLPLHYHVSDPKVTEPVAFEGLSVQKIYNEEINADQYILKGLSQVPGSFEDTIHLLTEQANKIVSEQLDSMLIGETKQFNLGPDKQELFVIREGNEFSVLDRADDVVPLTSGSLAEVSADLVDKSEGLILFQKDNWSHVNDEIKSLTLLDVFKKYNGLPNHRKTSIKPEHYHAKVKQYRISKEAVQVCFTQQNQVTTIPMDFLPYVPVKSQHDFLERNAGGLPPVQVSEFEGRIKLTNLDGSIPENADAMIKEILLKSEQNLTSKFEGMLDGEKNKMFLGNKGEFIEVEREGASYHLTQKGEATQTVAVASDMAKEIMGKNIGVIIHERADWKTPFFDKTLKEVLKETDGFPKNANNLTPEHLNTPLKQFRVRDGRLEFAFKGQEKMHAFAMETHKFLSRETKNMLIDQAASATLLANVMKLDVSMVQ